MSAPADDLVAHAAHAECVCGPVTIPIVAGTGEQFVQVAHRRLDGQSEPARPSTAERTPRP